MKQQVELFKNTIQLEAQCLEQAIQRLEPNQIENAAQLFKDLNNKNGALFCIGVGKSGFIAKKIASTFSSLGLQSYFMHPTEALHGDLGQLTKNDAVILISNSGTTEEIIKLLPFLPIDKEKIIGLIGNTNSPIAQECGILFDCFVEKEACLSNQAPTSSTTLALAMGDALAVLFEDVSGFTVEKFAKNHPGGKLGKKLSLKVDHLMHPLEECPQAREGDLLIDILLKMTKKPVGICNIVDEANKLIGILVEGDIRRIISADQTALNKPISEIINREPIKIETNTLASEALKIMSQKERPIGVAPIVNSFNEIKGVLRIYDILQAGL